MGRAVQAKETVIVPASVRADYSVAEISGPIMDFQRITMCVNRSESTERETIRTKMLLIVLFTVLLFLTPQAEAHVGVSSDHEDTNRPYDQEGDADHRHKIRAIGVPGEDYTKTHLEDDGLGTKIVSIPVFDRDSMSPCYEINSAIFGPSYSYTHRRNPHPFAGEGMTYPTLNPPHNVSVIAVGVEIAWAGGSGPGLDYETASVDGDGNHYYDYTITAWDEADVGGSNCRNSVGSAWKVSETFRLYVTDVDETIKLSPDI